MSKFDHEAALRLGGWDPRYAVVLATASRDGVAAALVDTNGDGADVDLDQYEQALDGHWVETGSSNCDENGAYSTGYTALAWGRTDPGAVVRVDHQAARYTVEATDQGWWMFLIPSRSSTVPAVVTHDGHDG